MASAASAENSRAHIAAGVVLLLAMAALIWRNAWLSDDAYITLRTVDHFVNGRGLVWNLGERVQAYTHPLWMFCMSAVYLVTGEDYMTLIVLGTVTSLAAVAVAYFMLLRRGSLAGGVALAYLLFSRSFLDYCTSGLENPLSHLLLAGTLVALLRLPAGEIRFRWVCLLSSAAVLNRLDVVLLCAPLCAIAGWDALKAEAPRKHLIITIALAAAPILAWELFSLVYYGSLVPNTALAKLGTGIEKSARFERGIGYLRVSGLHDPALALAMAALVPCAVIERKLRVPLIAVATYLLYVVYVGGGFMVGRFCTAPGFLSVACVAWFVAEDHAEQPEGLGYRKMLTLALASNLVLALGLTSRKPWAHPVQKKGASDLGSGIVDEQGFWWKSSGLGRPDGAELGITHVYRTRGEKLKPGSVSKTGSIGYRGYFADPSAHIVDWFALADPFLARLPAKTRKDWKPGHFARHLPKGYLDSLESGDNELSDPELAELFADVQLVTRAPLFSSERWQAWSRLRKFELTETTRERLQKPKTSKKRKKKKPKN